LTAGAVTVAGLVAVTGFLLTLAVELLRGLTSAFFSTLIGAGATEAGAGSAAKTAVADNTAIKVAIFFILISFKVDLELTLVYNNCNWHQESVRNDNRIV